MFIHTCSIYIVYIWYTHTCLHTVHIQCVYKYYNLAYDTVHKLLYIHTVCIYCGVCNMVLYIQLFFISNSGMLSFIYYVYLYVYNTVCIQIFAGLYFRKFRESTQVKMQKLYAYGSTLQLQAAICEI